MKQGDLVSLKFEKNLEGMSPFSDFLLKVNFVVQRQDKSSLISPISLPLRRLVMYTLTKPSKH